ncbi:transcriptional regulator family: Fungal Specific TF [Aspergillus niger]|nr:transcriptional regulator family: Fungal Specific TF [Aspergillus niger]KAI2866604.1 transcriptional regulator family: Fungal Specific TF [Aspergillus niger]KAI2911819.1 transcriptional regulator family: Fungal Specific TF [Aspergillus niger]KAI2977681.1 transcriptional regulator family: Fungal Specific TF [Aspergillus niger]KAI2985276.1 transcriptional regulator family: Fungal Specific TF [Aspergillus niger]
MHSSSTIKGRRSHRKSRSGCQQCKLRKVKCGEEKPACSNCKRHGVHCSFALSNRMAESTLLGDQSSFSSQTSTPQSDYRPSNPSSPSGGASQQQLAAPGPELAIADLELLHHYSTSTAYTFSLHPVIQTLWRIEVPQIAFTAPYTLRAILAVSALHLAVLRPEKQEYYISQASFHHDASLKLATPEIANITHDNCTPLFLFSALSSFICCAKPLKLGNFLLWEDHEIANWLMLIRGTGTIVDFAEESLKTGPLRTLFSVHRQREAHSEVPEPPTQHQFLEDFRRFVIDEVTDVHEKQIYHDAIFHLGTCFTICYEKGCRLETSDVFMWLLRVPHDFLGFLKEYRPLSMVIVGYFCVLLHQLEWIWCMKGWGTHILSQIYNQLREPVYRAWLQWPMEQIGILPPR